MSVADLIVEVRANLDEYTGAIEAAAADTEEFSSRGSEAMAVLKENITAITAATAATGAALEGFARSQAGTNEIIAQLAIVTGETEDSLRKMVGGLSDSTNSSGELVEGMDELVRQGVTTKEKMAEILPVMDDFAGATGKTIPEAIDVTKTVLGSLGIDLDDAGEHVDALTRLLRTTDTDVGTLTRNLAQVPDELQGLDFDTSDVVAGIEIMIDKGYDGEEGIREFRRMIADSKGDFDVLLGSLNVTAEEFGEYKAAVDESKGITKAFAEANAAQITPIQQLQNIVGNLGVKFGDFAAIAADLAPALLAVGPAITAFGWVVAALASPIGIAVAAVAGAIAIGWALYENWDQVKDLVSGIWESVKIRAEEVWSAVTEAVETFVGDVAQFFTDLKDDAVEIVVDMKDAIVEQFTGLFDGAIESVQGMVGGVTGWLSDMKDTIVGNSIIPDMVDEVLDEFFRMGEGSTEATMDMSTGVIHEAQGMFDSVSQIGRDIGFSWLQSVGDLVGGSIENFTTLREIGSNLLDSFREVGTAIGNLFAGDWTAAMDLLSSDTISSIASMATEVTGILGSLWNSAKSLVGNIAGALSGASSAISSGISSISGAGIGASLAAAAPAAAVLALPFAAKALFGGGQNVEMTPAEFDRYQSWRKERNLAIRAGKPLPPFPLAEGGIVRSPTFAMIGESGPEAVIPLNKTRGIGGMNVTINQRIDGALPDEVRRQTERALKRVALEW